MGLKIKKLLKKAVIPAAMIAAGYFVPALRVAMWQGAMYGAVIGAAGAVVSGGNVFKLALKGAIIGGITGGVVGAVAPATTSPTGAAGGATGGTVDAAAAAQAPTSAVDVTAQVPTITEGVSEGAGKGYFNQGILQTKPSFIPTVQAAPKVMGTGEGMVYAGLLGGAGTGLGNLAAAEAKAKSDKEIFNRQSQRRAGAQPVEWRSEAPRITAKAENVFNMNDQIASLTAWQKYFKYEEQRPIKGLLQGVAA